MATWSALFVSATVSALALGAGCAKDRTGQGGGSAGSPGAASPAGKPAQTDGIEGLRAFIKAARDACAAKDYAKGKALVLGAIPSKDDMKKVLVETVPLDALEKLDAFYKQMPPDDEKVACLFSPDPARSEVGIYAATVEQIDAYEDGTDAYKEFPGGAKEVAPQLRPGRTFYEVEMTEPGQDSGTKFHMFYWDGKQWRMLGPLWRAFQ